MTRVADEMFKIFEGAALERYEYGADGGMGVLFAFGVLHWQLGIEPVCFFCAVVERRPR